MSMKSSKAVCEEISSGFIADHDRAITALADRLESVVSALADASKLVADMGEMIRDSMVIIEARLSAIEGRNL